MKPDLVIRGGTVVDGTGRPPREADVVIQGDRIAGIGCYTGPAGRIVDARGKIVTPGFVDVHTHLDAQITWDPLASPSILHGVTSIVVGNCGVGFAPCRPADLAGGDAAHNAAGMRAVFAGEDRGPHRDALVLNAALVLELTGTERDSRSAVGAAGEAIDRGDALRLLEKIAAFGAAPARRTS